MQVRMSGATRFQILDEDGDELPGSWDYAWEGRDPFEAVMAAVTEVSGRPWEWSARGPRSGRFSPIRCKKMAVRVSNSLRKEQRAAVAAYIARVVAEEFELKQRRKVDAASVLEVLNGKREPSEEEREVQPELLAAVMLRGLRDALKAAVECDGGLRVQWRAE
ncbi:MAG: hypothetical protein KA978_32245 [Deltaproteobacteria bacterium]|jgi:hypothetical protein|nr:hypothetical protein [Deltaproteobacteria bacterium]